MAPIKPINLLFLLIVVISAAVHVAFAKPRDLTVFGIKDTLPVVEYEPSTKDQVPSGVPPVGRTCQGRVECDTDEDAEHPVCQELCLPKGYTYGLCISKRCTCV